MSCSCTPLTSGTGAIKEGWRGGRELEVYFELRLAPPVAFLFQLVYYSGLSADVCSHPRLNMVDFFMCCK